MFVSVPALASRLTTGDSGKRALGLEFNAFSTKFCAMQNALTHVHMVNNIYCALALMMVENQQVGTMTSEKLHDLRNTAKAISAECSGDYTARNKSEARINWWAICASASDK